jgi:hypothetical protein
VLLCVYCSLRDCFPRLQLGTVTASEIFDDGFVCLYKCRQTDGVDKQDPSVENLTKTVDVWNNSTSSITVTYLLHGAESFLRS